MLEPFVPRDVSDDLSRRSTTREALRVTPTRAGSGGRARRVGTGRRAPIVVKDAQIAALVDPGSRPRNRRRSAPARTLWAFSLLAAARGSVRTARWNPPCFCRWPSIANSCWPADCRAGRTCAQAPGACRWRGRAPRSRWSPCCSRAAAAVARLPAVATTRADMGALTRDCKKAVQACAERDFAFREALLC